MWTQGTRCFPLLFRPPVLLLFLFLLLLWGNMIFQVMDGLWWCCCIIIVVIVFTIIMGQCGKLSDGLWWWCRRLTRDGLESASPNTVDIYDSIRQTTNDIHRLIKDDTHGDTKDALTRAHLPLPPPASSVFPSGSLTSPLTSESRIPTFLHNSTGKPRIKEEIMNFDDERFFNPNSYLEQVSYYYPAQVSH